MVWSAYSVFDSVSVAFERLRPCLFLTLFLILLLFLTPLTVYKCCPTRWMACAPKQGAAGRCCGTTYTSQVIDVKWKWLSGSAGRCCNNDDKLDEWQSVAAGWLARGLAIGLVGLVLCCERLKSSAMQCYRKVAKGWGKSGKFRVGEKSGNSNSGKWRNFKNVREISLLWMNILC